LHVASELVPPPPGRKDRQAAKIRNVCAIVWTIFLLGFFLLPARWVHQPTIAVLDLILWPIVRLLGKPATVGLIAVMIAVVTLAIQKLLTDNHRLLEAKRRAAALKREADQLPAGSRRRELLMRLASPVHLRTLMAAMAPIGILLGPMVMPFVWFQQRMDPTTWNAPAGSAVQIVAMVESDWMQLVTIQAPESIEIDQSTPVQRALPPIRRTLEHLLALYNTPQAAGAGPWELAVAPDPRGQSAQDLRAYLDAGVPPQGITWQLRPPENFDGRFSVEVIADGKTAASVNVVLGDKSPPSPSISTGAPGSPVKSLRVSYAKAKQQQFFWRPFARFAGEEAPGGMAKLASFDIGWLWLYILVYLPALFVVRGVLKVA
jgi:hypothetical protein